LGGIRRAHSHKRWRHFKEIYWHPQPQRIQAELVLPSPASETCQPSAAFQKVEPSVELPVPTQENRGASLSPIPSLKYSRQPSRASCRRPSTPRMDQAALCTPSAPYVALIRTSTPSPSDEQARQVTKTWIEHSQMASRGREGAYSWCTWRPHLCSSAGREGPVDLLLLPRSRERSKGQDLGI